MDNNLDNPDF
jgi:hypothetical protein